MTKKTIHSLNNLTLRPPALNFSDQVFKIITQHRAYLSEWMLWVDKIKEEKQAVRFLKESMLLHKAGYQFLMFLFMDKKLIGSVGLMRIQKIHQTAEIGYWIIPEFQKQGLIQYACRQLINHAFQKLNLQRLEIRCIKENKKSIAVPKALGFKHEGSLKSSHIHRGKSYDIEVFALLYNDWLAKD